MARIRDAEITRTQVLAQRRQISLIEILRRGRCDTAMRLRSEDRAAIRLADAVHLHLVRKQAYSAAGLGTKH